MEIRPDIAFYGKYALQKIAPVAGQIEVTSSCFQNCAACESWRDDLNCKVRGTWSEDEMVRFMEGIAEKWPNFEHLSLTGGDPQAWEHLDNFLWWFGGWRDQNLPNCKLQISTALTQDIEQVQLWRNVVDDVRVSLDAVTPELYAKLRGDKTNTPEKTLARMEDLNHKNMSTITTVFPGKVSEVCRIADRLGKLHMEGDLPLRRAMFLSVLGPRADERDRDYWAAWRAAVRLVKREYPELPTSFGDSITETREVCQSEAAKSLPCFVGNLSFHVKANGDYYPCCLVGGEALATSELFRVGNARREPLDDLYRKVANGNWYGQQGTNCSEICQYKQLQVNLAAVKAAGVTLAMP